MVRHKRTGCCLIEYGFILLVIWVSAGFISRFLKNSDLIFILAAGFSAVSLLTVFSPLKIKKIGVLCFRFRWVIALLIFLFCLAFRVSGSSIGVYNEIFPTQIVPEKTTVFGSARWIRSDEYGVQTPTFFSQQYNAYSFYSKRGSLSPVNMVLDYYSPVLDWTAVGKPLMWGYLFFGNEIGLSWYWCAMIILLGMTALEMLLILTENCRWASVLGAAVIVLSPAVQWWVMPHMPVVLLYAMALFCIGYHFFTVRSTVGRWGFSVLALVSGVGFALSIFPSFQVPCAYAVGILLAACLWRDRSLITLKKREWVLLVLPAAFAAGIIVHFFVISREDIAVLMNTAYPGSRISTGGNFSWRTLFTDMTSLFLPYWDITYMNNCEVSSYIHFAPFFFFLFPRIFFSLKKNRSSSLPVGTALTGILLFCALYMCIGISPAAAKLTLLKYCNRMNGIYGWLASLYTAWGMAVLSKHPDILRGRQKLLYPLLYGVLCVLIADKNTMDYFNSIETSFPFPGGRNLLGGEILLFTAIPAAILFRKKRLLCTLFAAVMAVSGITVNPLECGVGAITNHPISRTIAEISEKEPDSIWLCTDCSYFFISNFAMANGARVLSSTNFYPDKEKWEILDPENNFREITNRYANQTVSIAEENSPVELLLPDSIRYWVTPENLKELDVKYLLSASDYSELLKKNGIDCTRIPGQDGFDVYRLTYTRESERKENF